jgi:hypothetical protein
MTDAEDSKAAGTEGDDPTETAPGEHVESIQAAPAQGEPAQGGPAAGEPAAGAAAAKAARAKTAPENAKAVYAATILKEAPWGAVVIIVGLLTIIAIFLTAILHYKQASEVATATSSVSGVIAALVGAYFGIRGSSLAQEKAQENNPGGSASGKGAIK